MGISVISTITLLPKGAAAEVDLSTPEHLDNTAIVSAHNAVLRFRQHPETTEENMVLNLELVSGAPEAVLPALLRAAAEAIEKGDRTHINPEDF